MKANCRSCYSLVAVLAVTTMMMFACQDSPTSPDFPPPSPDGDAGDDPLNACFTAEPQTLIITAGQSVALDASCTEGLSAEAFFAWDFGNGQADSGSLVEAKYRQPGDFDIRLTVTEGERSSSTTKTLRVNPRPVACFSTTNISAAATKPCTVRVDASCSTGSIEEYEWFFEGGPEPPISLPDVTVTTEVPVYEYSWAEDEACHSFRPFERTIRLTVHDESGVANSDEDVVVFSSPALRR